jgi:hypothetical protein
LRRGSASGSHCAGARVQLLMYACRYPKLAMLVQHKHDLLSSADHSIPPTYLASSSTSSALQSLQPHRFDVILLSPPADTPFEELRGLELGRVAASPGFVWLWVGSGAKGDGIGLEKGRELIAEWGYRRCEDIVWLKTNKEGSKALGVSSDFGIVRAALTH